MVSVSTEHDALLLYKFTVLIIPNQEEKHNRVYPSYTHNTVHNRLPTKRRVVGSPS